MKKHHFTQYWLIGALIALSGCFIEKAEAQINERRVERQATGVYKGKFSKLKRVRLDPMHGNETTRYDNANARMRVPVTEKKVKTKLKDNELEGSGLARIKANGKKTKITRGGKKIAYLINKGIYNPLGDGHNPIKQGIAKGDIVSKGRSWIAKFGLKGKRIDNDLHTSLFSAYSSGKH